MIPLYFPPINALGNSAFRKVCLNSGAKYVFTEMVNVECILEGLKYQIEKLEIPLADQAHTFCQIICKDISNIEKGVDKIMSMDPFLKEINYNMGCPRANLSHHNSGGWITRDPKKVFETAKLLKFACDKYNVRASVKLRIGFNRNSINVVENVRRIREAGIKKVYIHGRCLKESYHYPATYFEIGQVKLEFPEMEVIANGDVKDSESLRRIIKETNCDGVLIGRAAIKDPFIFGKLEGTEFFENKCGIEFKERIPSIRELLNYAVEYNLSLFKIKANIVGMTKNVTHATEFRGKLNDARSVEEISKLLEEVE